MIRRLALLQLFLACSFAVSAQLVGGEAFLHGVFVEVGVNDCGAYGSSGGAPAGYHPNIGSNIGFVADSDMDGWGSGSPVYCGDYFLPGAPEEGFAVQVGANVWYNSSQNCFPDEIPGSVTGYDFSAGVYSATWEGNIASENLDITTVTSLPENALYFLTTVTFCNTGATPITEVYYMRNVDPDQDLVYGGTFMTTNEIVSNPPEGCDAVVTSVGGGTPHCFMAMGARTPNARASYGCFNTSDGEPATVYAGGGGMGFFCSPDYEIEVGSSTFCDCATQMTLYVPEIAPGGCEEVKFVYILDLDFLDEALDYASSYEVLADDVNITDVSTVTTCQGDTILFEILGGDAYTWEWFPPTFLDTDEGTSVISIPLDTVIYYVTGYADCDTIYDTITVNAYTVEGIADAGPDAYVCPGDTVYLAGSGGNTYLWQPPTYLEDPTDPNTGVNAPPTDMYYFLIAYNELGCADTDVVFIDLLPEPDIDAGQDYTIVLGGFTQLHGDGAYTYSWSPTETLSNPDVYNPIANPQDTTTYYLTAWDEYGCIGYDSVTINVIDPVYIVTPNAFSPNGDNLNDIFRPVIIGPGTLLDFQVYNRWGEMVFEWTGEGPGWDGTLNGVNVELGTYIVTSHAQDDLQGKELFDRGTVILMR
ncbi:MAG: gliding motility-associated C-terminal domain-containing protein [Chitinophagales bacterium]|nr:gliding motility-associated C-terminal domain-containing protein [Chitinophagales bacterium]